MVHTCIMRNNNKERVLVRERVSEDEMFDSMFTRSTAVGILMACPHEDLAPLIDWMADRSRENSR